MASTRAGLSLSFVEPYLLDYRVALGLDMFYREQLAEPVHFVRHQDAWASARGLASPCAKISPCSFGIRFMSRKSRCRPISQTVTTIRQTALLAFNPSPAYALPDRNSCGRHHDSRRPDRYRRFGHRPVVLQRRRSFVAGSPGTGERPHVDLVGRLFAGLQHAGQQQEPDRRPARRLQAGFRRRRR